MQRYVQTGEQLIVIRDDIDLPLGKLKLKRQGGDAGRRGIGSIIACLGHRDFSRIRVGIGWPSCKEDIVDDVLSPFTVEETDAYKAMIAQAVEVALSKKGICATWNKRTRYWQI